MTHFVPNTYGPRTFGPHQLVPLDKRSPTNSVPLDKWSPKIWSSWTNGPHPIWSPKFKSSHLVPLDKRSILGTICLGGQSWLGTICPGGQNWLGTVYPEGPINWGPIVGDQMSGDHMCLGPNVRGPYVFGNKCVTAGQKTGSNRNQKCGTFGDTDCRSRPFMKELYRYKHCF